MEILDAECQLDYKKLTFDFYAEQYVNFNELVTDLFKIWKLRIWLSAVNPASFSQKANVIRRSGAGSSGGPGGPVGPGGPGNRHMDFSAPNMQPARPFYPGDAGVVGGFDPAYVGGMGRGGVFAQPYMPPYGAMARGMGQQPQSFAPNSPAAYGFPGVAHSQYNVGAWTGPQLATGPGRREPMNIAFGALSPTEQLGETTPTQASVYRRGPGMDGPAGSPLSALHAPNPIEALNARLSRLDVHSPRH